jgi:hypothetical protein
MKKIPSYAPHLTARDIAFYRSNHIQVPEMLYETNKIATDYTLSCYNIRNGCGYTYSNRNGFGEDQERM